MNSDGERWAMECDDSVIACNDGVVALQKGYGGVLAS